jgi:Ger(x)C family germination protein
LLIICSLFIGGCYNYRDLNRLFFTTVIIVDVDDKKNIIVYSENFKAYRGQGEKQGTEIKVIFKGTGKTDYAAFDEIIQSASYEINYSQIKAIIFTERAALYGIDNFIDGLLRDQKPTLRSFLFVYPGDPEELLELNLADEQFIGLFLDNLMVSQGKLENIIQIRFDKYLNMRLQGSGVAVTPRLKIITVATEKRLSADGGAVFVNDKMVDKLSPEEAIYYNYIINEAKAGFLYVSNPEANDKYVSLKILSNKTKVSLDYDGETVHLIKNIKTKVTLIESQKFTTLSNDEVKKQIEKEVEEKISTNCVEIFERFKKKGIDLYNVQRRFEMKYPHANVKNALEITKAVSNVDVHIEGSNNTSDFK